MKRRAIDDKVVIRWFAVPNTNTRRSGFSPAIEINGRLRGGYSSGYDREVAELMAEAEAREAAQRYTGDWRISVRKGAGRYIDAAIQRDERHWRKVKARG